MKEFYKVLKGSKGQALLVLPEEIRKQLNVQIGDMIAYISKDGDVVLKKVTFEVK